VALDDDEIDLFVYYCSGAKLLISASPKYQIVELPPDLAVGPEYGLTVSQKRRGRQSSRCICCRRRGRAA
jgi:hypothetical protein